MYNRLAQLEGSVNLSTAYLSRNDSVFRASRMKFSHHVRLRNSILAMKISNRVLSNARQVSATLINIDRDFDAKIVLGSFQRTISRAIQKSAMWTRVVESPATPASRRVLGTRTDANAPRNRSSSYTMWHTYGSLYSFLG